MTSVRSPLPEEPFVLELNPPRFGLLWLAWPALALGLVLTMLVGAVLETTQGAPIPIRSLLVTIVIAGALGYTLFDRLTARNHRPRVEFYGSYVSLPKIGSRKTSRVRYEDLTGLYVLGRGGFERLFIDGGGQIFMIPRGSFDDVEDFARMSAELWRRIHLLPDGSKRLAAFARKSAVLAASGTRPVLATKVLLFSIVAMYILEFASGAVTRVPAGTPPIGLISLGANASVLLENHQYFRLLTSAFLHDPILGTHLHVLLNGVALYSLGTLLEQLLGSISLATLFFFGAIFGSILSALGSGNSLAVGSSNAVLGVFGGLLVLALKYRTSLPLIMRQTQRWWVVVVSLNVFLPIQFPMIDRYGHAGGLIGGVFAAVLLTWRRPEPIALFEAHKPLVVGLASALIAVCALTVPYGVVKSWMSAEQDEVLVLSRMIAGLDTSVEVLNGVAFGVACDQAASEASLEIAEHAAERAFAKSKADPNVGDTWATVLFRLGEIDRAITMQRESLQAGGENEGFFASQLERFLAARVERIGPMVTGTTRTPTISVENGEVTIETDVDLPESTIFLMGERQTKRAGLVRVRLPALKPAKVKIPLVGWSKESFEGVRFTLALYSDAGPEHGPDQEAQIWPHHAEVAILPNSIVRKVRLPQHQEVPSIPADLLAPADAP